MSLYRLNSQFFNTRLVQLRHCARGYVRLGSRCMISPAACVLFFWFGNICLQCCKQFFCWSALVLVPALCCLNSQFFNTALSSLTTGLLPVAGKWLFILYRVPGESVRPDIGHLKSRLQIRRRLLLLPFCYLLIAKSIIFCI